MGMFDDLRRIMKQSNDFTEASGRPTSFTGRVGQLPDDLRHSADAAEFARTQQAQAAAAGGDDLVGGIAGTAVLHGHRPTTDMVGFQPVSNLDLEIRLPGAEPYRMWATVVVPYQHLVLMTVGRELAVRVDPNDVAHVVVDWP